MFKKGQNVWHIVKGEGIVEKSADPNKYTFCIKVRFFTDLSEVHSYTSKGFYSLTDLAPSIYPFPVELPEKQVPKYHVMYALKLTPTCPVISDNRYKSIEHFKEFCGKRGSEQLVNPKLLTDY